MFVLVLPPARRGLAPVSSRPYCWLSSSIALGLWHWLQPLTQTSSTRPGGRAEHAFCGVTSAISLTFSRKLVDITAFSG